MAWYNLWRLNYLNLLTSQTDEIQEEKIIIYFKISVLLQGEPRPSLTISSVALFSWTNGT